MAHSPTLNLSLSMLVVVYNFACSSDGTLVVVLEISDECCKPLGPLSPLFANHVSAALGALGDVWRVPCSLSKILQRWHALCRYICVVRSSYSTSSRIFHISLRYLCKLPLHVAN